MPQTTIVYICSPDRYRQLSFSLGTLLKSGTRFSKIVVFCIGNNPGWDFGDERVDVRPVPNLYNDYFYGNKLYVCDVDADRVVFLDTDTLVFSPMDRIWSARSAPVIARVANAYGSANWNGPLWKETCSRFGEHVVPMFNTGFLVFQNGSNRSVRKVWKASMELYRAKALSPPFEDRMSDQYGLSLAISACNICYEAMSPSEHTYGWIERTVGKDTVVFHTANSLFEWYLTKFKIERPTWLKP
jgi:hypothetical protein